MNFGKEIVQWIPSSKSDYQERPAIFKDDDTETVYITKIQGEEVTVKKKGGTLNLWSKINNEVISKKYLKHKTMKVKFQSVKLDGKILRYCENEAEGTFTSIDTEKILEIPKDNKSKLDELRRQGLFTPRFLKRGTPIEAYNSVRVVARMEDKWHNDDWAYTWNHEGKLRYLRKSFLAICRR